MSPPANAHHDDVSTVSTKDPFEVAWLFVQEFYTFMNKSPEKMANFYGSKSSFLHGIEGGNAVSATGTADIHTKYMEFNLQNSKVLVSSLDAQSSSNGGIIVQVIGEMSNRGEPTQKFTQTFFLAPQPNGYYVLNDIFRFLRDDVAVYDEGVAGEHVETAAQQQVQPQPQPAAQQQARPAQSAVRKPEPSHTQTHVEAPTQAQQVQATPEKKKPVAAPQQQAPAPVQAPATTAPPASPPKAPTPVPEQQTPKTWAGTAKAAPVSPPKPQQQTPAPQAPAAQPTQAPTQQKKPEAAPSQPPPATAPAPAKPKTWASLAASPAQSATTSNVAPSVSPAKPAVQASVPQTQNAPAQVKQQQQQQAPKEEKPKAEAVDYSTSIYIRGVDKSTNLDRLREALAKYGEIKHFEAVFARACAFAQFATREQAFSTHGVSIDIDGRKYVPEERRERAQRDNRSANRGGDRRGRGGRGRGGRDNNPGRDSKPQGQQQGQGNGKPSFA